MTFGTKKFDCGCEFPLDENGKVIFDADVEKLNLNCKKNWSLLAEGQTQGIFQLESNFGKSYAKKLKPSNIEELSALLAILRPSAIDAKKDGKSITQHYIDRKNGLEEITYYHPMLEETLKSTHGEICYQEQAMEITVLLAGFTLQESDDLRKAMGKKLPEEMSKLEKKFIEGCEKKGIVTKEEAKNLFEIIRASQRYSFNRCLHPNTLIETKGGPKTIQKVENGEFIKTIDGWTEIINKYDNGIQELYEIELEGGKKISCTLNHRFLCGDMVKRSLREILEKDLEIMVEN